MSDATDHNGLPRENLLEDELLAAEYALGVLAGAERDAAERRVARDGAFARMVEAWDERLAPWAADIEEMPAPPQVWGAIVEALPLAPQRASLWENLALWRSLAVAAGALAACCIGVIVYLAVQPPGAPLMASIDGGGRHHFVATIDPRRATVAVAPANYSADPARVPELWLIPADGKPHALGLLRADQSVTITIPAALLPHLNHAATLAVSLEPPGGSPTGAPTGPVIGAGKLTNL